MGLDRTWHRDITYRPKEEWRTTNKLQSDWIFLVFFRIHGKTGVFQCFSALYNLITIYCVYLTKIGPRVLGPVGCEVRVTISKHFSSLFIKIMRKQVIVLSAKNGCYHVIFRWLFIFVLWFLVILYNCCKIWSHFHHLNGFYDSPLVQ